MSSPSSFSQTKDTTLRMKQPIYNFEISELSLLVSQNPLSHPVDVWRVENDGINPDPAVWPDISICQFA